MAHLNKLAIRGIRSFDDKQISVIEFFSPVTVIVGHNGSGKTTIIECLKYATTGDQPANTRGGAFIHDPKMANEKEVKAQVKLRFHAANGTRMLAVRNLSVTVKKTSGLMMKTLESILALADGNVEKGGKRGVISTKCAEMDIEIPQLLGVSKAVLENVIFCHQEDSYWPLAEPAALKKKFDDIFEATRYTKALDSIKNLRKERMADLKAEKERLMSLLREKAHADKLKEKMSDLKDDINNKEVEYEESKQRYDTLVDSNRKFYESYSKFREMYLTVQNLEENKTKAITYLTEVKAKCQIIPGSHQELETKVAQFKDYIKQQKEKQQQQQHQKEDHEEELSNLQNYQKQLLAQQGRLQGEAEEQSKRMELREQAIRECCELYKIKGFNHSPLEREKIVEFFSQLSDIQKGHQIKFENLQSALKAKVEEYHNKLRTLDNDLEVIKSQRLRIREQTSEKQDRINKTHKVLEQNQDSSTTLRNLQTSIEDSNDILGKKKKNLVSANFEARLIEVAHKIDSLEQERNSLNGELQQLTKDADARARVEILRSEVKKKRKEMETLLDEANKKLVSMGCRTATADKIGDIVERLYSEKEIEQTKLSTESKNASIELQKTENELGRLKNELKHKKQQVTELETTIGKGLEEVGEETVENAITTALNELSFRQNKLGSSSGSKQVYQSLLSKAKQSKKCGACNRHLDDHEFQVFQTQMQRYISQPDIIDGETVDLSQEVKIWEAEVEQLQKLRPIEASLNTTKKELVPLQSELTHLEGKHPEAISRVDEVNDKLDQVTQELKETAWLKQTATNINRLQHEIERDSQDAEDRASGLLETTTTKTAEEVQGELNRIAGELKRYDQDQKDTNEELKRRTLEIGNLEKSIHRLELDERDLQMKVKERERLEDEIEHMKQEIATYTPQIKELDKRISEAQAPINALQDSHNQLQREFNARISETQKLYEDVSKTMDRLTNMNKDIDRYVKEKKARALEECSSRLEQCDTQLRDLQDQIEASREVINTIEKEINESGVTVSNLQDNIFVQKVTEDIANIQAEIESYDMEEAAKARRNYEDKYEPAKRKEDKLGEAYHQLTGEIGTLKSHLQNLETDLKDYKDVYKNYTDQLIKVKISDMANNDLEKYVKALDNAIMKYHSLKMEEVNDTMKHLWNKTYQGTDIDGIKISADVEGGASKRSYNYRVVMTKDQVEMDMRGRCSAGQKMLASIIIRLALSDSFGQNCGILALDEPTNALDTENIDALAASLVDIINERKAHSNFQLIIITHDENFLKKLGQSNVMEYYWRVKRDSRQKSVIERQRF